MTIERILVLEREGAGGESLEQMLSAEGYQVLRARDVGQATRLLRSGPVQMCILEVHSSLVDVRDFVEKVRVLHPDMPRVLYAAPRDLESVQPLLDGGDEVLVRPAHRTHMGPLLHRYEERLRLAAEADRLRQELYGADSAEVLLQEPRGLREVMEKAARVAADRQSVVIRGPRGSGRKLLARYLHESSSHSQGPLVVVHCARILGSLQESELFGHEPGAFPGAADASPGVIELAHGGTLVLEEVSYLAPEVQHRLHRFLQNGTLRRMGGQRTQQCHVRVIATTSQDLQEEVTQGHFSPDLLRRLGSHVLTMPALIERKQDIPLLARRFVTEAPAAGISSTHSISPEAVSSLTVYDWPGNVTELRQVIERAVHVDHGPVLLPEHLPLRMAGSREGALQQAVGMNVADMEREMILRTLEQTKGNRTAASKLLGLTTRTLSNKIRIYRAQGYHVIGGRKKRPQSPVLPS